MFSKFPTFAALSLLMLSAAGWAQPVLDDRTISIRTPAQVAAKRQALTEFVWGPGGLPLDRLPRLPVIIGDKSPIRGLADLERVDTLIIEMDRGINSYAHHFIPRLPNRRLVVLHHGHQPTFDDSQVPDDISFGMRRTIEGLLGDGYSVLAVYMPKQAEFVTSITVNDDGGDWIHDEFFQLPKYYPETGSPMKYFLEPLTASLNYLSTRSAADDFPEYIDFNMVGFSGGGWAATVYAALDTRIRLSIVVAGTIPLYLRSGAAIGDTEQTLPEFYSIAGYPELYVLGSDGPGRKQVQVLNRNDWCCFGELHHDWLLSGGMTYDESVRDYEGQVRSTLVELGNTERFSLEIDQVAPGHNVTWDTIYDTILPELNEGRRYVGSATGDEAVVRGANGSPAVFSNGVWSPTKLAPVFGTPAILSGAVSIHDMFYRTTQNQLVHASRPPFSWSRARLLSENVISDPAATSRGPGSFDVVALKTDYKLYHFRREGNQLTSELVTDYVKGLGPPSIVASGENQLDVVYRSWNRQLYHARKLGDGPWTINGVGGRMLDFPTAVMMQDGTFLAFVRGQDGGLWEATLPPGIKSYWGPWVSVSGPLNAPTIGGSPSAIVNGDAVSVSTRTPEGRLVIFSNSRRLGWAYVDYGGSFSGSPTATQRGTFTRGTNAGLVMLEGPTLLDLGGFLD